MCGAKPKGSGLQNLRECIIQTKWKYDVAPEDKQVWCHSWYNLSSEKDKFVKSACFPNDLLINHD